MPISKREMLKAMALKEEKFLFMFWKVILQSLFGTSHLLHSRFCFYIFCCLSLLIFPLTVLFFCPVFPSLRFESILSTLSTPTLAILLSGTSPRYVIRGIAVNLDPLVTSTCKLTSIQGTKLSHFSFLHDLNQSSSTKIVL